MCLEWLAPATDSLFKAERVQSLIDCQGVLEPIQTILTKGDTQLDLKISGTSLETI
jgi:hypothetical protein